MGILWFGGTIMSCVPLRQAKSAQNSCLGDPCSGISRCFPQNIAQKESCNLIPGSTMIYPGFNSKKLVPIFKAKQQPDLAGSFQAKIHCFFLMVSEVFISQIHEIYPSHRWIHMGLWVVGQKTSVGSSDVHLMIQWPQGEAGNMCFGSLIFFRAARGCQICLKPMLTCSDIACLATTGNNEQNMWQFSSEIKHQTTQTTTRYSMLQQQGLKKFDGLTKTTSGRSNSIQLPQGTEKLLLYDAMQGNTGQEWYGYVWLKIVVQFHHISPYFTHEVVRLPCASILV